MANPVPPPLRAENAWADDPLDTNVQNMISITVKKNRANTKKPSDKKLDRDNNLISRLSTVSTPHWTLLNSLIVLLLDTINIVVVFITLFEDNGPAAFVPLKLFYQSAIMINTSQLISQCVTMHAIWSQFPKKIWFDVYVTRLMVIVVFIDAMLFIIWFGLSQPGLLLWRLVVLYIQFTSMILKQKCIVVMDDSVVKPVNTLKKLPPIRAVAK